MIRRAETGNVVRNLQQSLDETIGHPRRNTPDTPDLITHPPAALSLSLLLPLTFFLLHVYFLFLSLSFYLVPFVFTRSPFFSRRVVCRFPSIVRFDGDRR